MAAEQESSRYGHRDATMNLLAFRHGLRAAELCDLQRHQVELNAGRLHVHRVKTGRRRCIPSRVRSSGRCAASSARAGRNRLCSPPSGAGP